MRGFEDYCWLVSEHADRWLKIAAEQGDADVNQVQSLRRELGAPRAHLVLEQASLRRRTRDKIVLAEQMFFTRKGYEQATDSRIARYKSQRFADLTVTDVCCGIGAICWAWLRAAQRPALTETQFVNCWPLPTCDSSPIIPPFSSATCARCNCSRTTPGIWTLAAERTDGA